jgi:pantoate--beta-alanine ligase
VAYFGQKDFQQFMIISKLVDELKFGIQLRCIPTFREPDGLAMSSRNQRLNEQERKKAAVLFRSLSFARDGLLAGKALKDVKNEVTKMWKEEEGVKLEYFELADRENLILSDRVKSADQSILLIAGYVGEVRLIDNLIVGAK